MATKTKKASGNNKNKPKQGKPGSTPKKSSSSKKAAAKKASAPKKSSSKKKTAAKKTSASKKNASGKKTTSKKKPTAQKKAASKKASTSKKTPSAKKNPAKKSTPAKKNTSNKKKTTANKTAAPKKSTSSKKKTVTGKSKSAEKKSVKAKSKKTSASKSNSKRTVQKKNAVPKKSKQGNVGETGAKYTVNKNQQQSAEKFKKAMNSGSKKGKGPTQKTTGLTHTKKSKSAKKKADSSKSKPNSSKLSNAKKSNTGKANKKFGSASQPNYAYKPSSNGKINTGAKPNTKKTLSQLTSPKLQASNKKPNDYGGLSKAMKTSGGKAPDKKTANSLTKATKKNTGKNYATKPNTRKLKTKDNAVIKGGSAPAKKVAPKKTTASKNAVAKKPLGSSPTPSYAYKPSSNPKISTGPRKNPGKTPKQLVSPIPKPSTKKPNDYGKFSQAMQSTKGTKPLSRKQKNSLSNAIKNQKSGPGNLGEHGKASYKISPAQQKTINAFNKLNKSGTKPLDKETQQSLINATKNQKPGPGNLGEHGKTSYKISPQQQKTINAFNKLNKSGTKPLHKKTAIPINTGGKLKQANTLAPNLSFADALGLKGILQGAAGFFGIPTASAATQLSAEDKELLTKWYKPEDVQRFYSANATAQETALGYLKDHVELYTEAKDELLKTPTGTQILRYLDENAGVKLSFMPGGGGEAMQHAKEISIGQDQPQLEIGKTLVHEIQHLSRPPSNVNFLNGYNAMMGDRFDDETEAYHKQIDFAREWKKANDIPADSQMDDVEETYVKAYRAEATQYKTSNPWATNDDKQLIKQSREAGKQAIRKLLPDKPVYFKGSDDLTTYTKFYDKQLSSTDKSMGKFVDSVNQQIGAFFNPK